LANTGYEMFKDLYWLEGNVQHRYRFEHRDNDFRRNFKTVDNPHLHRTRAYLAVKEIADPFRATMELQDSRMYNTEFPRDNREWNTFDVLQGYGELYFKESAQHKTLSVRVGRMAFEELDRRLIARNEWRNTTNNFQGVRTLLGTKDDPWQLDAFAFNPVERLISTSDERNERQIFYGGILHLRENSKVVTWQPFFLGLKQDGRPGLIDRNIYSPGLRAYGWFGDSGFDWDASFVYQFGRNGTQSHQAIGAVGEVGYRWQHDWKPRVSLNYGYGSGDENPNDSTNERFERFFGFARPWSNDDYFQWENLHAPKFRVEFQPSKDLRIDTGYNGYWLASDTDRWNVANLRDPTGRSGDFLGQEYDIRLRYKVHANLDANLGYAYFKPGEFTQALSRNAPSHFAYVELTFSLFE
ncbi:MAG: alginate export family protein, partial [Rickettsiales bacterium]|nr:alginate export family protein [Rickettsiales bacterium]